MYILSLKEVSQAQLCYIIRILKLTCRDGIYDLDCDIENVDLFASMSTNSLPLTV
jgi:hypothetical protein